MAAKIKYPIIDGQKQCGVCLQIKQISEFDKSRNHLTAGCKNCRREYAKNYRQKPEVKKKTLEYLKTYRAIPENKEKINSRARKLNKTEKYKELRNSGRRKWAAQDKQKCVD